MTAARFLDEAERFLQHDLMTRPRTGDPVVDHHTQVQALAAVFDRIRSDTLERAAQECECEARCCESHARGFQEEMPRDRMPVHRAHTMAANQSRACGHRVLRLKDDE